MKAFAFIIFISLLFIFQSCFGTLILSGYVFDYDTGNPVSGAAVEFFSNCMDKCDENNKSSSYITNKNGFYKLEINEKDLTGDMNFFKIIKQGYITFNDSVKNPNEYELIIYLKKIN